MRKIMFLLLAAFFFLAPLSYPLEKNNSLDSAITSIVSRMNSDSISYVIKNLQDFQSRFLLLENRFEIANWIESRFRQMGYSDVEKDSFLCHTAYLKDTITQQVNVVATITGTQLPDNIYIIGGHYDSYTSTAPYLNAPGADDNASGIACTMEFARVLKESGYQPKATIKFIAFAAEELMLSGDCGSKHYALNAFNTGMNIKLMINADMVSYTSLPLNQSKVSINYYSGFDYLLPIALQAITDYSLLNPNTGSQNQWSDSYPFYQKGFPAIYFEEDQFSPYYHTINDVITNYSMDYCREVSKAAAGMLLSYQNQVTDIRDLEQPENFVLHQNYPNPFNPNTMINFYVPRNMQVSVKVYDLLGREIAVLLDEEVTAGNKSINFNSGKYNLSSGIYLCEVKAANNVLIQKMILLK